MLEMLRPRRILLVEDNSADLLLVRTALENAGVDCRVSMAIDGAQAIEFIDRSELAAVPAWDLVLLDMTLPKRSGEEVLRRLRSANVSCGTPVVVLTGTDSPEHRAMAEELGASRYFYKPADLDGFMMLGPLVRTLLYGPESTDPV